MAIRRRCRRASGVGVALLMGVCLLAAGCSKDSEDPTERTPACGLVSSGTLREITDGTKVSTLGAMVPPDERQHSGEHCQVYDAADVILQITVVDNGSDADARSTAQMVNNERRTVKSCLTLSEHPHHGYLCVWEEETIAVAAMPKRLIRLRMKGPAQRWVTPARAKSCSMRSTPASKLRPGPQ